MNLISRRDLARCWKIPAGPVPLVAGIIGALLIYFFSGQFLIKLCGDLLLGNLLGISFMSAAVLTGLYFLHPAGQLNAKAGFRRITFPMLKFTFRNFLLVFFITPLITAVWQVLLKICRIPFAEEQPLLQMVRGSDMETFILLLYLVAVAVPLAEELIFRRGIYELLQFLGCRPAFFSTALLFSAAHGFLLGGPGLFFTGLIFQRVCNRTRNLWCSILCHGMFNAAVMTAARLLPPPQ